MLYPLSDQVKWPYTHFICGGGGGEEEVKVHIDQSLFQCDFVLFYQSIRSGKIFIECNEIKISILSLLFVRDKIFFFMKMRIFSNFSRFTYKTDAIVKNLTVIRFFLKKKK